MWRYEFELHEIAACCGAPIVIEYRDGNLYPRCACHQISIENWSTDPNGPSLRVVCDHACQRRLRLCRRLVQNTGGRVWRQLFESARGRIFQSGSSFLVTLDVEDGRQLWFESFEAAYCQLTGLPWQPEGGEL
jgi:hypothetical protein